VHVRNECSATTCHFTAPSFPVFRNLSSLCYTHQRIVPAQRRRHFRHFNRLVYLLIYLPYSDVSTLTVLESFFHYLIPLDSYYNVASPQVATVQKHPETYFS